MPTKSAGEQEAKGFAELLDEALYRRGVGSASALADELAEDGNLNGRQIAVSLRDWRGGARAGESFDLALRVAIALPELLDVMAQRAGLLLVPAPSASKAGDAGQAAKTSGEALSLFWTALEKGEISAAELLAIRASIRKAEENFARLEAHAIAIAGGAK